MAAAAAFAVLVAGIGTWIAVSEPGDPVANPLAVSEEYIDTFNAGDADGVLALITPDAQLSEFYVDMSDAVSPIEREFFEQQLAWEIAQGTVFVSPECLVTAEAPDGPSTVVCEFGWNPIVEQTIGASPIPTILTLGIDADKIVSLYFEYPPEFSQGAFDRWMDNNHPEVADQISYGEWDSVADAEQNGLLRAQYAQEFVDFVAANNCVFNANFSTIICP